MRSSLDPRFYEVAAQVIPVMFLALAFQMRYFEVPAEHETPDISLFLLGIGGAMIVGEITALSVIESGEEPSDLEQLVVWAGVALPLLPLGVRIARPRFEALRQAMPEWALWPARILGLVALATPLAASIFGFEIGPILAGSVLALYLIAGLMPSRWRSYRDESADDPSDSDPEPERDDPEPEQADPEPPASEEPESERQP